MNATNLTLDLNKILQPFIARIIALEDTVRELLAQSDKPETRPWNEVAKTTMSRPAEPKKNPLKPTRTMKNSPVPTTKAPARIASAMITRLTACSDITAPLVKTSTPPNAPNPKPTVVPTCEANNTKLPYAPARSMERQIRMARGECFGCGQKGHTHKNCPTHAFDKIRLFLKPDTTRPTKTTKTNAHTKPSNKIQEKVLSNLSKNPPTASAQRTHAASTASTTAPRKQHTHVPSPCVQEPNESGNELS